LYRIEGYVIVSADGNIADAKHEMPPSIHNDADQAFFQSSLDRVALIVHGRHSCEGGPHAPRRRRLIVTSRVASIAADETNPNAKLWNPAGATIEQAAEAIGVAEGDIAIIGGPAVFTLFLPRYDVFHLSCATKATIPGGLPVFSGVGPSVTPSDILTAHGLTPGPGRNLDAAAGVFLVTWQR
jgi:dihydrofolate reductase